MPMNERMTPTKRRYLFTEQKGQCAVCHEPPSDKGLAADRDEQTGKIIGLLCPRCLRLMQWCHHDIGMLQRARDYSRENVTYDEIER